MKIYRYFLLAFILLIFSCGGGKSTGITGGGGGGGITVPTGTVSAAATITLTATPPAIIYPGSSTIEATVLDASLLPVPDGTQVDFMVTPGGMGAVTLQASTVSGVATAIFTASGTDGTAVITATSGAATANISVDVTVVATINLTATPASISVLGTSSISAEVLDGAAVAVPDGTVVTFSINNPAFGTITSSASTFGGFATATFTALNVPGTVTVTATSGISNTIDIDIAPVATATIEFVSAVPSSLAIRGTSGIEISNITFLVKDANGSTVADGQGVDFCLIGPAGGRDGGVFPVAGGEFIDIEENTEEAFTDTNGNNCYDSDEPFTDAAPFDGVFNSPWHYATSTAGGAGEVTLTATSGIFPGNVTIVARVTGTLVASSSPVISIGGGTPDDAHFTVALSTFNLPGLLYIDRQATITVLAADRVGNGNVLEGTTVSYMTESGATPENSSVLDDIGQTTMIFRTQHPDPKDVAPEAWETSLQAYVNTKYGVSPPGHPRDGYGAIRISMEGEESFVDVNGNGIYDGALSTDTFTDTQHEPFIDFNDNGVCDIGGADPDELYLDKNINGVWDGNNGFWDGPACPDAGCQTSKTLFRNMNILITGPPFYRLFSDGTNPATTFTIADGGSQGFDILISDINLNYLSAGTEVSISVDAGKISGFTSYIFPDVFSTGPLELSVVVADSATGDTDPPDPATLKVTVTWEGIDYVSWITGTID